MRTSPVIIVQARMTSTRLPGKVLAPILGRPMLAWTLERLARVRDDVRVAVATTDRPTDDEVAELCAAMGIPAIRGSETDVLDRYWEAATKLDADPVIRITADCPLIDPEVSREVLVVWESSGADYASNTLERRYPRGLDTEVMSRAALGAAWKKATEGFEREHVTPFIYTRPKRFRLASLRSSVNEGERRWTVDTAEDLEFVRTVYGYLAPAHASFRSADVRALLNMHPEIERLNRSVVQKGLQS